jgi:hypothetical protein
VYAPLDGLFSVLDVQRRGRRDDHRLQARDGDHVVEFGQHLDALRLEVFSGPAQLVRRRRADAEQTRAGHALQDVEGMSLSHPPETHDTDVELARCNHREGGIVALSVKSGFWIFIRLHAVVC